MGYTIYNDSNDIDYDLKKIKLQVLVSENLESKINKRIAQISLNTGDKIKPVSTYVRELIEKDTKKIKNK
jgi:predicted DNA-binding protein